jgi:hypothetical protein
MNLRSKISFIIISPLALLLMDCGSGRIIKHYTPKGILQDIEILDKGSVSHKILFEYDSAGRITKAQKFKNTQRIPVAVRIITYDQNGKLRILSHKSTNEKRIDDIWVESFFYNYSGELLRAETSYKSSYSIANNKTPLLITRYLYANGRSVQINADGGVFKKEAVLRYKKNSISQLDFKRFSIDKDGKKTKTNMNILFDMNAGKPAGGVNLASKASLSKKEALKIFKDEKIDELLKRLDYAQDYRHLLSDIESQWTD